jgi:hypothetical protein
VRCPLPLKDELVSGDSPLFRSSGAARRSFHLWGGGEGGWSLVEIEVHVPFFFFFKTGFLCVALAVLNSLCRPGWPRTQKSTCLCLPSAGIKGVCHHTRLCSSVFVF